MSITIVFSNKASALNRKLIKFFEINLLSLNKTSVTFDFEVAHPSDAEEYAKRGINNYPTLVDNSTNIAGAEKIMTYLQNIIKKHNSKILNKTDNDRLDDFWKDTIGKIELDAAGNVKPEEEDGGELSNVGDNLHHRIQEAFEQRNSGGSSPAPKPNIQVSNKTQLTRSNNLADDSPSKTIKKMKAQGRENSDDILMAKFFENQEESI
jgi:hypothetical protein